MFDHLTLIDLFKMIFVMDKWTLKVKYDSQDRFVFSKMAKDYYFDCFEAIRIKKLKITKTCQKLITFVGQVRETKMVDNKSIKKVISIIILMTELCTKFV